MPIDVIKPNREFMNRCIARYPTLRGARRTPDDLNVAKHVLGYLPPNDSKWISSTQYNDVPAIIQTAGFCVYFVECVPGSGCEMHNHDTTETFIIHAGTWQIEWEGELGKDTIELNVQDVMSFPPGIVRSFVNLSPGEGRDVGVLIAVVGGNLPVAEHTHEAVQRMITSGEALPHDLELYSDLLNSPPKNLESTIEIEGKV